MKPNPRDPAWRWCALAGMLAAGSIAARALAPDAIDWQPALAWTQPWRWWTAAFVHFSTLHLMANLAGVALLAVLGWRARVSRSSATAWLAAWPLTQLALALQPSLARYGGLSGVLHAGVAIVAVHLWRHEVGARRWLGVAVLAGLAAKLLAETPWSGAVQYRAGWDIGIAPFAHVTGTVAGLVGALAFDTRRAAQHRG